MKFRKKPVEVAAVQLRRDTWSEMRDFLGPEFFAKGGEGCYQGQYFGESFKYAPEGIALHIPAEFNFGVADLVVVEGQWVIRGTKGELYPCDPEVFEASYEAVP